MKLMEVFIGLYPDMCQVDFGGRPSCHKMAKFYIVIFESLFYINLYMTFRKRGGGGGGGVGVSGKCLNDVIIKDKIDL